MNLKQIIQDAINELDEKEERFRRYIRENNKRHKDER